MTFDSTQNSIPHDHQWLTAQILDKNHNMNKAEGDVCCFVIRIVEVQKQQH